MVQKRHLDKTNDKTYNIIMNEKPRHRFHLRYVVYSAGVFLGFGLLYKYNTRFRLSCQKIVLSYKCGQLYQDFKSFIYNSLFAEEASVKKGLQLMNDRYHEAKSKLLDTEGRKRWGCLFYRVKCFGESFVTIVHEEVMTRIESS